MLRHRDMSDEQLRERHSDLLRLQKQELQAGNKVIATDIARERQRIYQEACRRRVSLVD